MRDKSVPAHWRLLGLLNGFFINDKPVYASNTWLAKELKCSVRTITASVLRLEKLGKIMCMRTKRTRIITKRDSSSLLGGWKPTAMSDSSSLLPTSDSNSDSKPIAPEAGAGVDPKLIVALIDQFIPVNPSFKTLYSRKEQRKACARLIATHGFEYIKGVAGFLPKSNATLYAPNITTPVQLENELGKLLAWAQKKKDTSSKGRGLAT